ncbi:MAG: two-component regulator propeller domain-containing protein [Cyclobacteriaceae bacterium]
MNKFLVGIFLFLNVSLATAQLPHLQTLFLKTKNEAVEVNAILQDRNGYIFVGTNSGLFKLDGTNKTVFTKADSLPTDQITALAQDASGKIWCGHKNGKISILDNNRITFFSPPEGMPTMPISDILFDRNGVLWFSTLNDGIYFYFGDRLYRLDDMEGLPDLFAYDLEEDAEGNIWVGTDGGIGICTRKEKAVTIKVLNSKDGLPDNIIRKIKIDSLGVVWIATDDAGLVRYDKSTSLFTKSIPDWSHGTISDLAIDGEKIWMTLPQAGLMKYNSKPGVNQFYNSAEHAQLASLKTILIDKQKNIWVGSKSELQITRGDLVEFIDLKEKLKDQSVLAIAVDKNKTTWFSTKEGLFNLMKNGKGNQKVEKIPINAFLSDATIISMYADSIGNVWAGLYGEGVIMIDIKTLKITYFLEELRNGSVLNISGRGNQVWIATLEGASRFTFSDGKWELKNYSRGDGLGSDYIYQVFVDSQERVWFATDREGIDMLDSNGFHHFEEGLESKAILGLAEDAQHQIWANVQGKGLFQWAGTKFEMFKEQEKLRENDINILCSDSFGNLVMAHKAGIDIYDAKTHKFIYLGEESGLGNFIPTLNCMAIDQSGVISIGTENGIYRYAAKKNLSSIQPIPHIVGFRQLAQRNSIYETSFSYNQNDLVVDYVGFWYASPDNVCFQYKLDDYDKDWITTRDRSTTYSSLPPGKFTFHLRVSSADCNGEEEAIYEIEISPPFWRTIWFYVLATVAVIFIGLSAIRYRERSLVREKRELEQRVHERTLELQRKTEEIQAQNEEIQSQSEEISGINENLEKLVQNRTQELEKKNKALEEYAFINAHNLRAPVASVLGLINLIKKVELDEEGKVIVQHLEESAIKLDTVVNSITQAIERGD